MQNCGKVWEHESSVMAPGDYDVTSLWSIVGGLFNFFYAKLRDKVMYPVSTSL